MQSRWIELGGEPGRFWCLSPREVEREAQAMLARLKSEREFKAWSIWTGAQLQRVDPKKFPKLDDFLRVARGEKRRGQTREEQIAAAYAWHALIKSRNKT